METVNKVLSWAQDRNLIKGATPQAQMLKATEELGELAHAVARKDAVKAADAIGDVTVVMIILAAQMGLDFNECLAGAYDEIKDRKGKMIDGVFVKEEA